MAPTDDADDVKSRSRRDHWIGAALAAVCLRALSAGAEGPPPPLVEPLRVDPWRDPWYILATLDGVGERTARRVAAVRDAVRESSSRPSLAELPGFGPRSLHRRADDLESGADAPISHR